MAASGKKTKGNDKGDPASTEEELAGKSADKDKKKGFSLKKLFIIFLVLVAVGASSFVVYTFYFAPKEKAKPYKKVSLRNVALPDETLKFCFEHFSELYEHLISYNSELIFIEQQIKKIEGVAKKYPDQAKIADKEKQAWIKLKTGLEKTFEKIQKPILDIHVQFLVNQDTGLAQIKTRKSELTKLAEAALEPVQNATKKLKSDDTVPEGLINGTLYKLKKKFL